MQSYSSRSYAVVGSASKVSTYLKSIWTGPRRTTGFGILKPSCSDIPSSGWMCRIRRLGLSCSTGYLEAALAGPSIEKRYGDKRFLYSIAVRHLVQLCSLEQPEHPLVLFHTARERLATVHSPVTWSGSHAGSYLLVPSWVSLETRSVAPLLSGRSVARCDSGPYPAARPSGRDSGRVFHSERFGYSDLHVIDVPPVPDRLENTVQGPKNQDVLDRLFAKIVIYQ
jgi:hypothetical protein